MSEPQSRYEAYADVLAPAVHAFYRTLAQQEGWPITYDIPYDQLPETMKEDNRAAAARIPQILALVGLAVRPEEASGMEVLDDVRAVLERHLERLAAAEHTGWMTHKLRHGWVYGIPRDDARKIHDALKPYNELSAQEKEKDRHAVLAFPDIVALARYKIVPDRTIVV